MKNSTLNVMSSFPHSYGLEYDLF